MAQNYQLRGCLILSDAYVMVNNAYKIVLQLTKATNLLKTFDFDPPS